MTHYIRTTLGIAILLAVGCHAPHPTEEHAVGSAEVTYLNDSAIQNAIIAQHTLYPYQFIPDAATLNELGDHDLCVLIEHFKSHPGKLNVRRGDTAEDLYQSRIKTVSDKMARAGVQLEPIQDGSPGGDGMKSDRVLTVLERSYSLKQGSGSDSGSMSSNTKAMNTPVVGP